MVPQPPPPKTQGRGADSRRDAPRAPAAGRRQSVSRQSTAVPPPPSTRSEYTHRDDDRTPHASAHGESRSDHHRNDRTYHEQSRQDRSHHDQGRQAPARRMSRAEPSRIQNSKQVDAQGGHQFADRKATEREQYNRGDSGRRDGRRGSTHHTRGESQYTRSESQYAHNGSQYTRSESQYTRGESKHTRGESHYNRGESQYTRGEPSHHEPSRHEPSRHKPSRHEPSRHEPSRHEPSRHEPSRHGPSRQEPSRQEPSRNEPSRYTRRESTQHTRRESTYHSQRDNTHRTNGESSLLASMRDESNSRASTQHQTSRRTSVSRTGPSRRPSISQVTARMQNVTFANEDDNSSTIRAAHQGGTMIHRPRSNSRAVVGPTNYPSQTQPYAPPTYHASAAGALVPREATQELSRRTSHNSRALVPQSYNYDDPRAAQTIVASLPTHSERLRLIPRDANRDWIRNNLYECGLGVTVHDLFERGVYDICPWCRAWGEDECREMQQSHEKWLERGRDYEHPRMAGERAWEDAKREIREQLRQRERDEERGREIREREAREEREVVHHHYHHHEERRRRRSSGGGWDVEEILLFVSRF